MGARRSRLETHESKWWESLNEVVRKHGLSEEVQDDITGLIYAAIDEDGARFTGVNGGRKGGAARAAKMTPEARAESASKAAQARWNRSR